MLCPALTRRKFNTSSYTFTDWQECNFSSRPQSGKTQKSKTVIKTTLLEK